MPRLIKSNTNAVRKMSFGDFSLLTKKNPEKSLSVRIKRKAGRDNKGHISVRHIGGGSIKLYRRVDFKFLPFEGEAIVTALEYDPNRSAFIALLEKGEEQRTIKSYILAPDGMKVGDKVYSGVAKKYTFGSRLKLKDIPLGYDIHNIELQPGRGGQIARSAGVWGTITAKEGKYAFIRMPSSEIRKIHTECMASVGKVSNVTHNRIRIAKAGRMRRMGVRPSVRGKAMNPISHPHGGGEGVNPIGLKYPKTPWGKPALGKITRSNKRTDKYRVHKREKK